MDSVRLRHVFMWDCPSCQRANEVIIKKSVMPENMLREAYGISEWEDIPSDITGDVMEIPVTVNCRCGEIYEVQPPEEWGSDNQ